MYDNYEKSPYPEDQNLEVSQNSYYAYLDEIGRYKLLSQDEEIDLFLKIEKGDNVAKDLFIKSNLRLVVKQARNYYIPGMNQLLDLIQDGNIGLIRAVESFDPSKGCKFSTYAVYHINKAIRCSSGRTGLPVELPQQKISLLYKIRFASESIENETGFTPSAKKLAEHLNVPVHQVKELLPFISSPLSLQTPMYEEDDHREFVDVFSDYYNIEQSEAECEYMIKEMKFELRSLIFDILNDKEMYILYSRYGLANMPVKDVATLAQELNMSKQGVRQSMDRSVAKLRKHLLSLNSSIQDFLPN